MKIDYNKDFPLLSRKNKNGSPLVYLDNAATTQKPHQVLDAVANYYETLNANPHRGAYELSAEATDKFEEVRGKVAAFIGSSNPAEIIFTSGATASLNMIADSYGLANLQEGDEILITVAEHHSNLLPWQRIAKMCRARLCYLYLDSNGRLPMDELNNKLSRRTKIVAVTHISNVLGNVMPVKKITGLAHAKGAVVVLDASQSTPHIRINVKELDVDFLAFSGHKMLAPTGIGVLYGKLGLLKKMEPVALGGGIVEKVTEQSVCYLDTPWKFEAGTPNLGGAIGLGAAIDYLEAVGYEQIQSVEKELISYTFKRLKEFPEITVYGDSSNEQRAGIISFTVKDVHPHDVASVLDTYGIAIRAGHHCAQPLMQYLKIHSACRISLYFYNTIEEIDILAYALKQVREVFDVGNT